MLTCAAFVVLTLVIGGSTRLTESGLSITEWRPITGALPPLGAADWDRAYQAYLRIPEAQTVHRGITLPEFKTLFWWEWAHRLVARLTGLVTALPFLWFLARRRIPRGWTARFAALPILTGAQGVLGWYMVASGLAVRTDVSQYRLVAHLGLALVIFGLAVWTWLDLREGERRPTIDRAGLGLAVLTSITILSGGFVAGLDAGHVYNTFPMMGDGIVPREYGELAPPWRNWFENAPAVQFNHRALAVTTLLVACSLWLTRRNRRWHFVLAAATVQVVLGITTLLMRVPLSVAAVHQLGAVLLLTAALTATHPAMRD